ncbi:MAG: hypothetical protein V4690_01395 [Patescibacteria group bacterium]
MAWTSPECDSPQVHKKQKTFLNGKSFALMEDGAGIYSAEWVASQGRGNFVLTITKLSLTTNKLTKSKYYV